MALAEATVRVTLEVSKFERDLRQKVTQAANKAGRDFDREMKSSMAATGKDATNEFRNAARTNMSRAGRDAASAFDNNFQAGISQSGGKAGQRLSQGLRSTVSRAGIDAGRGFADNVTNVLDASGQHAGERLIDSIAQGVLRGSNRAGKAVGRSIDSAATAEVTKAGTDAGKKFSLSFGLGTVGGSRPIILALASLGSYAVEALRPATGILAAFPALFGAITTSAVVGVVAFKGVGTAIKALNSGDLDKINAAMAHLSPQAQAFAHEVAGAGTQLRGLKQDIQDAFFGQFNGQIRDISHALGGTLHDSLVGVGTSLGSLARQFTSTFSQAQGVTNLNKLFAGTSGFLDRLAPGLANLSRGFLNFVGGTAPGLKDIGQALGDMLTKFGLFLTESGNSGKALVWLEGGIAGMRNLASEVGDLVHAFTILFNAAQPLSFLLGGLTGTLIHLVGAFGDLPVPLQTAALAAILLANSGLPDWLKKTTAETGPVAKTITQMGAAYRDASASARDFINNGTGLNRAVQATGGAFDAATGAAGRLANTVRSALATAADAAEGGLRRAGNTIQNTFIRAALEADNATARTSQAIQTGFVRAGIETERAFTRMAEAGRSAADTLRSGLIPTALAIDANVTRAEGAASRFAGTLRGLVANGASAAASAVSRAGDAIAVGFARSIQAAETAANHFGTAVQTGIISASIAGNNALNSVGNTLRNSVLRPLVDAQTAYRTTSTSVRDFAAAQTALNNPLGQSSGIVGRVRDSFTDLRGVLSGAGSGLSSLASGPLNAAKTAMTNLGSTAAGVGGAITKGLGSAVTGITGALGGPWGLAITGATVALSFLSSAQDEAKHAAAEHAAEISTLTDTLNKETGAVTAATRQQLLTTFANNDAGASARKLGIDLGTVAAAATGNVAAQDRLYAALRKSAEAALQGSDQMGLLKQTAENVGVPLEVLENALLGNASAVDQARAAYGRAGKDFDSFLSTFRPAIQDQANLGARVGDTARAIFDQAQKTRDASNAMTPAQANALRYADALLILSDRTSTADQKARALADALDILAGGSTNAEIAQGRFTELIANLGTQLGEASKGLQGYGDALLTNTGHINTQTTAGAFLIGQYDQIRGALTNTVGATIEAGKANGDLDGALIKVGQQTAAARGQFIETAKQLGLNEQQANQLADAYGLIPAQVLTTVTDQGSALNTQLQVTAVGQKLKDLPINTPVTVQGLTQDAIQKLNEVGIKTRNLPNGEVEVTATTMQARAQLDSLIASYKHRVIEFGTAITGGKAMGDIVHNAVGRIVGYANGGKHMRRMSANRAEVVAPNTWRIIGDRARDDEAYIPINRSHRSRALLAETARRMGFSMFADGGMNSGSRSSSSAPVTTIATGAIVVNAPYADPELVAKATLNALAREAVS